MAAVVVTAQNDRLDDAEATTDWVTIGGGAGIAAETDFFYQNTACIARKGGTAPRGFRLDDGRTRAFDQIWHVDITGPTFVDETVDANSTAAADWDIFPLTEAAGDYLAIGQTERFSHVSFDNLGGTAGVGGVVVWEYWNGAWTALSGVTDGTTGFTIAVVDNQVLTFTMPTDWVAMVLNGSASLFYIRARITTVYTTNPVYDEGRVLGTNLENGLYTTVMFKQICTTPGLLETLALDGLQLGIGNDNSNHYLFDVEGSDTYPARTNWLVTPIDPNVAAYRDETAGTPVLSRCDYFSTEYDQTGTSKDLNQGLDAVDVGAGLTLVGGDGADTDGLFQDFVDFDFGTIANRFGYVSTIEGILLVYGMLVIGSASATVFQDTGTTLVFPDGLFAQGFSGITVDLTSATTDVDWTDCNFFGKGSATTEETRPVLTITGTTGDFDADGCVFDAFDVITLTSAATLLDCTVSNSLSLIRGGGTLNGLIVFGATNADNTAFIVSTDLGLFSNCDFTFSDGHAIEITVPGTYTFSANIFTGYGADGTSDAAIFNNSGGLVTINVTNGGTTVTFRNGSGASTVVNNNISATVTVKDAAGVAIQGAQVSVRLDSDNSEILGGTTNSSGVVTGSVAASAGAVSVRVRKGSGSGTDYVPINTPQTVGASNFEVTVTMDEDVNNAT